MVTDVGNAVNVSFAKATYDVPEGDRVVVTVTLSDDPDQTVVIPITKTNRGTTADADYSGVPANVTFHAGGSPGPRDQTFTVTATDDRINDDGESLRLTFGTLPGSVTSTSPSAATVSITDDDVAGVTLSKTSLDIGEGGSETYTVVLTSEPTADVTIESRAPSGSASELTVNPSSLTFTSGDWESSQTVTVSAGSDDGFTDDTGTITHRVTSSDSDYNNRSVGSVAVRVDDDEEVPVTVKFGRADYTVAEGGTVDVTVSLNRDPQRRVEIPIDEDEPGTGRSPGGFDYSGVPSSVTFESGGDTSKTITFEATDDDDDDDGESVRLSFGALTALAAVTAGTPSASTISITDDDHPIVERQLQERHLRRERGRQRQRDAHAQRGARTQRHGGYIGHHHQQRRRQRPTTTPCPTRSRSGPTTRRNRYRSGRPRIPSMTTTNRSALELMSSALPDRVDGGTHSSTTVSINDDDGSGVLITPTALTVPEGGSRTYTVKLTSQPTADVTVDITSDNSDVTHNAAGDTLTFTAANWASNQTVRVSAAEDADHLDDTATISHRVTSSDGDYAVITPPDIKVTVTDDEKVPVEVNFERATYVIDEGDEVTVTVTLDADPERTVTIPFVKTEVHATRADYGGVPSSVTFRSGDTEQTFTVTTVNDTDDDDDERIDLAFGTPPDAVTRGSVDATSILIEDDDDPQVTVSFKEPSYRVAEGADQVITVTLNADPKRDVTVEISATGQEGVTLQGDPDPDADPDYFGRAGQLDVQCRRHGAELHDHRR